MTLSPLRSTAALLTAVLTLAIAAEGQIRVTTHTVPIYVTVTDNERRLVPGLVQEDFEVYDNGKLQTLTAFSNEPQPITAVVMIDTSGSMTLTLDLVKQAAEQFLIRLLPEDKAKVGAFNDKLEVHPGPGFPFTSDRDQLVRLLKELDFGDPTRLYDAVALGIDELQSLQGRKVVVVFTDGEDTSSRIGSGDVLERARLEEVMVYTVGLENQYYVGGRQIRTSPDRGLRRLSDETGGGFFVLEFKEKEELGATFTRVVQELHAQYLLGFTPAALDGKVHELEVKVKRPGMTPRARKSYVAAADDPGTSGK